MFSEKREPGDSQLKRVRIGSARSEIMQTSVAGGRAQGWMKP